MILDFRSAGTSLSLHEAQPSNGGNLSIVQAAHEQVSLTLQYNGTASGGAVYASNVLTSGDPTGWTNVDVKSNMSLEVTKNLDTDHDLFNISVEGALDANNLYLMGKDTNAANQSTLKATGGRLSAETEMRVGGYGSVEFTMENSLVSTQDLNIYDDTVTNIVGTAGPLSSEVNAFGDIMIGTPVAGATFTPGSAVEATTGAQVNIGADTVVRAIGSVHIGGGNGLIIDDSGELRAARDVTVAAGLPGRSGPILTVESGAYVASSNVSMGGGTSRQQSGMVDVKSGGTCTATIILSVTSEKLELAPQFIVENGATASAESIYFGYSAGAGAEVCNVDIGGTVQAQNLIEVGDNTPWFEPAWVGIEPTGHLTVTAPGGLLNKNRGGYVGGSGAAGGVTAPKIIKPAGTGADFVPGDGFTFDDNGSLVLNPSPSDPFGFETGSTNGWTTSSATVDSGSAHSGAYALRLAGGHQAQPANAAKLNYQFPNISKLKRLRPAA